MKQTLTEEVAQRKRMEAIQYFLDVFSSSTHPPVIYCLTANHGRGVKDGFRFFAVFDGNIVDVTYKLHYITQFPIIDRVNEWLIYTHRTNASEVVYRASEIIFPGKDDEIRMEKL